MISWEQLEQMKKVDIAKVDKDSLVDITDIYLDEKLGQVERVERFIAQVKNPYAFRVGNVAVKVEYTPGGPPLSKCLESYLTAIRK